MKSYRALLNQTFSSGDYAIVPLRYEDRMCIMQWRNEQIYHLRQSRPLTEEDQENYFKNVIDTLFDQISPQHILFSYLENETCIGYGGLVHIDWNNRHAEISFIMDTALEKEYFQQHWSTFLMLVEEVAFRELQLHKIFTYAFDLRPHLYPVLETSGYTDVVRLKDHCYFEGRFLDVIIHARFKTSIEEKKLDKIYLRNAQPSDVTLLFEWANDPEVRANSINQETIPWENHVAWFNAKLYQSNSKLLILMQENEPVGSLRLDPEDTVWSINYSIDKKFRGQGFGKAMIQLLIAQFADYTFKAVVKKFNAASSNVFEKNGFQKKAHTDSQLDLFIWPSDSAL